MNEKSVVIDHDILGWGNDHTGELLKQYQKVLKVGSETGLERRKPDVNLAFYCKNKNCDLLTGDRTAYQHYFEVGVKTVRITRYDWIGGRTDKAVFLIQIVE